MALCWRGGRAAGGRLEYSFGRGAYCDEDDWAVILPALAEHVAIIIPVRRVAMHDQPCLKVGCIVSLALRQPIG
jgi:hypothetical protein